MMEIPFIKIPWRSDYLELIERVFQSGIYVEGRYTREFESRFSKFIGVKHAVAVNNGTSALFLILKAIGIGEGDKVIVPSFTFISTVSQILLLGAIPIFVDIDPFTYTIDIEDFKEKYDKDIKAVIVVHTFGHPADMDLILEYRDKYGFYLIEDACQAHGSLYKRRKVGGIGDVGFFSFYPTKNMTVYGEGGMIVSNNEELIEEIRLLKNHGLKDRDLVVKLGYNMNFNEIQAILGLESLKMLNSYNERRREIASMYDDELSEYVQIPVEASYAYHIYHLYTIQTDRRDDLRSYLESRGISTGVYYSRPTHMQPAVRSLIGDISLYATEYVAERVLSLPIYPSLSDEEVGYIIESVKSFYEGKI